MLSSAELCLSILGPDCGSTQHHVIENQQDQTIFSSSFHPCRVAWFDVYILRTIDRLIISLTVVQITACGVCVWYLGSAPPTFLAQNELSSYENKQIASYLQVVRLSVFDWKRFLIFIKTIKPTHTRDTWPNNHQRTKYFPNKGERAIKISREWRSILFVDNTTLQCDHHFRSTVLSLNSNNFFKCIKRIRGIETQRGRHHILNMQWR